MPARVPLSELLVVVKANNPYIEAETLKQYATVLNLVERWRPGLACADFFRIEVVREFIGWLTTAPIPNGRKLAKPQLRERSTVKGKMNLVRILWRRAKEYGYTLEPVPEPAKWPKIKVDREDPVAWSLEEMQAILRQSLKAPNVAAWTPHHWYTSLAAYFSTVERHRALLACEWTDLNWSNILSVRARTTKTGTPGTHRLPHYLAESMRRLPVLGNRIWPWPYSANSMRYHYKRYILRPLGFAEGRDNLFHCLRRTGITELVNQMGLQAASEHARHSDLGLTVESYVSQAKLKGVSHAEILGKVICPK